MKRALLILLVLLSGLLFIGCGDDEQSSSASPAEVESTRPATTGVDPTTPSPQPVDVSVQSITVGGMGVEYAEPVRTVVDLGVTARRSTVEAASQAASASAGAMTQTLLAAGVEPAQIQTSEFSINPYYGDYPVIAGYETRLGYRVTLPGIDEVGAVLASAVTAGGDDVRAWGIRFETDTGVLIEPAREQAWADVEMRAESLAALAGEPLGEVLDAHEKVLLTSSQGMMQGGEGDAASFDIPVSPGVSGVTVLLTVTFAIGD